MIFLLLLVIIFFLLNRRENYDALKDEMEDRWADVFKSPYEGRHKYINQIDYYRDAPSIDLGRITTSYIDPDTVDRSKLNEYQYSQVVSLIQGIEDIPRIKSINAN